MRSHTKSKEPEETRLRLYIAGMSARSMTALETVKNLCEQELCGQCSLEVIDIYQQPEIARDNHIIAVPTLIKAGPDPVRVIIGDLSNPDRIRSILGLTGKSNPQEV